MAMTFSKDIFRDIDNSIGENKYCVNEVRMNY